MTAEDAAAKLREIFNDLQTRFHDQWEWMDADFSVMVLEAALTSCREERDLKQCAIDTLGISLRHVTEERDRAQATLQEVLDKFPSTETLKSITPNEAMAVRICPLADTPKVADVIRWHAALKPVSDRQREGEKPCQIE